MFIWNDGRFARPLSLLFLAQVSVLSIVCKYISAHFIVLDLEVITPDI
jgi:hypothetical protein